MERVLLDEKAMERSINRIAHEILEKNQGSKNLSLIGIRTRGIFLAKRIRDKIRGYGEPGDAYGYPRYHHVPGRYREAQGAGGEEDGHPLQRE